MKKKEFKAESKKILNMMINSIYTNKEIFLRELISNASDAIDKLYYLSSTNGELKVNKDDLEIRLEIDKDNRTLKIIDNGIGMDKVELENNLGTIAKSGTELFKESNSDAKNLEIIGQFGVGFYSSFMIAKKVEVLSRSINGENAYLWESDGVDGYTITDASKDTNGTEITLYLKDNTDDINYDDYLDNYTIERIVKKYSDYIKYPIKMDVEEEKEKTKKKETIIETKTLNSMIPIWKKKPKDVTEEEYHDFYIDKFYDYEHPLKVITSSVEGLTSYNALLFIPSHAPFNYYTKEYEKGLMLYSKGVMIMDKCADLLPDYFSFVKGIVDSEDISLNISRETMQEDKQIKLIAKSLETKIKKELENMLKENREDYEKFYEAFGEQIKYGIYSSYGMNKELLQDLLLFYSSSEEKLVTLDEYVSRMDKNDKIIYYASGETVDKIKLLPSVEEALAKGCEVLFFTNYLDEFVIKTMGGYKEKNFMNVNDSNFDLSTEEEKKELEKKNEEAKDLFNSMKEILGDSVKEIRYTNKLKNHPVCLITEGDVSLEMEKVLNAMPNSENVKANKILEINENHPISKKLKSLYEEKKIDEIKQYTKILYAEARLIEGMSIENPTEITNLICDIMSK
ncbi:MAG: molecular chaperone HtpG [Bacilli bacterium]|nr:molecular chaperone HtpG [Bacilli bacterium]